MKETVLVTGGAGYIGSHTAVELIQAGFDVVIADNLSNSDLQAVEGVRRITGAEVPFEQIDCCDLQAMRRLFERHEFRSVIHFAASKAVGESVAEPLKLWRPVITPSVTPASSISRYSKSASRCSTAGDTFIRKLLLQPCVFFGSRYRLQRR